jgi:hypothetical protein
VVVLGRKKAGTELSLGDDGELGEEGVNHLHHGRTWGREGLLPRAMEKEVAVVTRR